MTLLRPGNVSGYAVFWTALLVACGSTVPLGSGNASSGDGGNVTASGVEGGSPVSGGDVEGGPSRGGIEGGGGGSGVEAGRGGGSGVEAGQGGGSGVEGGSESAGLEGGARVGDARQGNDGCAATPTACPAGEPANQGSCSLGCTQPALTCFYGCTGTGGGHSSSATCDGHTWMLTLSATQCAPPPADAGVASDAAQSTDGCAVGLCPPYAPADQAGCALGCGQTQLQCRYDCAHTGGGYIAIATCDGQSWSLAVSLTGCAGPILDASAD